MFTRFEAIYLKANDPITKRALWIREQRMAGRVWRWCVLTDPGWDSPLLCKEGPGEVEISTPTDSPLQRGRTATPPSLPFRQRRTDVQRGGVNSVSWSLVWDDPGEPLRLMPWWMYGLPLRTKYESPHWNGRVSGELVVDNTRWQLTHWPAQQGHLWGLRMAPEWAWAHGNCFVEDHTAAFEILTSGGRTVLCLRTQAFHFLANSITTWRCTQHETSPTHWNWTFQHHDLTIAGQFRLGYAEMVHIDYPAPGGGTRHCANTKVGSGQIEVSQNGRPLLQLTAHDTLAWEMVSP